jgi:hypothetical protein
MSDFNSSLPVRTQTNGDVVAFLADGTTPTQLLAITAAGHILTNLSDGAGTAITSETNGAHQALDVMTQSSGSVTGGTAAAFSDLAGAIYNSTPPTLTTGQQVSLQVDSAGRLLVDAMITFPYDTNWGTVDATTLRTAAEIGNATGAADFNAGATGAQTLRVAANQGAPNTIANAWPTLITNGTNTVSVNASGQLSTTNTSLGSPTGGAAGTQSSLAGGIYNSTPPTLTTGEQASLQLDSAGRLLVDASVVFPYDENWGVVGATTLRTAAQIGNATGAADFNWGAVGAQTLRVAGQIGNATGAADFNAGATGAQTLRVAANQGAPNTVANAWPTLITNGTNTASVSAGGELSVTVSTPLPAGTNTIGNVGVTNLPTTVDTNWGTVGASTIRAAAEIGNATGAADFNNGATGAQTLRVAANLAVAGADVTSANPVPVSIVSTTAGTAVQNYQTYVNLAAGASTTFTYTVAAGHTFNLERVWSSGSGKIKSLVQNNGSTIFVGFNSTANPNIDMTVVVPPLIAAGNTVTVTITNNDLLAFDVYVTIEGNQN